ncbi:MAG: hypothetical protein LBL37_06585, partial [Gracilibacteraceae bacterium]|nr:hypothetical protein [Gracilibacteraceae bacterium]
MRNTGYITITVEESADWEVWRELVAMPPEERNIFVKKILSQALALEPAPAEISAAPPQDVPDEEIPAPAAEAQASAPAAKTASAEPAAEFAKCTWGYRYTLDGAAP